MTKTLLQIWLGEIPKAIIPLIQSVNFYCLKNGIGHFLITDENLYSLPPLAVVGGTIQKISLLDYLRNRDDLDFMLHGFDQKSSLADLIRLYWLKENANSIYLDCDAYPEAVIETPENLPYFITLPYGRPDCYAIANPDRCDYFQMIWDRCVEHRQDLHPATMFLPHVMACLKEFPIGKIPYEAVKHFQMHGAYATD